MRHRDSLVARLVAYAAASDAYQARIDWCFDAVEDREFGWVIAGGLGPLLYHATGEERERIPAPWRDALLACDLTAKLRHENFVDTAGEVIRLCTRSGVAPILLKGISTSEELYPAPHLRPMGDIDLLVPRNAQAELELALLRAGYRQAEWPETPMHHHGVPLQHPERGIWVEFHTELFPTYDPLHACRVFTSEHIAAGTMASVFRGYPVERLSHELQLVYIAASWMRDLTVLDVQPSFLSSLFDALFLLRAFGRAMRWDAVLEPLCDDMAAACLYVVTAYIAQRRWFDFPSTLLARLAPRQNIAGPLQTRATHWMLDRYLLAGKAWDLAMPLPVPGRYSLRRQWRKRVVNRGQERQTS